MTRTVMTMPAATELVRTPVANAESSASQDRWAGLFRVAGLGALATGILIPLQIVAFILWPLPEGGVVEWFDLFAENPMVGLISFDLVLLIEEVLLVPIVLALYVLLRGRSPSLALITAGLWLLSIALFIGSNTGFDMLALSNHYASATSDADRAAYLAAGQAALTSYMEYGTSFTAGYVLASLAGVLTGVAMLRSRIFPALAGWAVLVANVLGFGLFVPTIGVVLSILSVLTLIAWYVAVGWTLLRLEPGAVPAEGDLT